MDPLRKIDVLGVAIACGLFAAAVLVPVRSNLAEQKHLRAQRASAMVGLAEREEIETRLLQAREEIGTLKAGITELRHSFPTRKEVDSFLSEIYGLARATDTELIQVVPGAAREGKDYSTVIIQIDARAPFEKFYRFLWGVDRMTRLSRLESLRISHDRSTDICTIKMNLYIFVSARGTLT
jgi:Tfp pilus assembly protein PilO